MNENTEFFSPPGGVPERSYAEANRELVKSFVRYMESRGMATKTVISYQDSSSRFIETLDTKSVLETDRAEIRNFLAGLLKKRLSDNSVRLHTAALRSFWKFIGLTELTSQNPTLTFAHRKVPGRLPRVLSVQEIEKLIAATQDPFERAVPEVMYATGVRVSELVNLRLENIDFAEHIVLVKKGKGGKDRYVLYGSHAAKAISDYLYWRPSKTFLFEAPARNGSVSLQTVKRASGTYSYWTGSLYINRVQRCFMIGKPLEFPTKEDARRQFDALAGKIPGFDPKPPRRYSTETIRQVLNRLAHRAGIGHVHPHALRRAMACHLLSDGGSIRAIQKLLGHERLGTTMLYTHLTAEELKKIHQKCHPHEQGDKNGEKK